MSSSNVSSSVPKPPGRHTKAFDSFTSMSLRVKKYFIETSFPSEAMVGLVCCSKGRRMLTPRLRSRPAPSIAAAMMPGPAPVTTIHPSPASASATSRAWA